MSMLKEFREFALKGNVIDMAVGVIIGTAFHKIVVSLVNDVLMPPLGLLVGDADLTRYAWVLQGAEGGKAEVVLQYGMFINNVLSFLIIAFVVFLMVKMMNRLRLYNLLAPSAPTTQEKLLGEIRDLLKARA